MINVQNIEDYTWHSYTEISSQIPDCDKRDILICHSTKWSLSSSVHSEGLSNMCLVGYIVTYIKLYRPGKCLLVLLIFDDVFQTIAGEPANFEGCYLYFDKQNYKWMQSGEISRDGRYVCIESLAVGSTKPIQQEKSNEIELFTLWVCVTVDKKPKSNRKCLSQSDDVLQDDISVRK